MPHVRFSRSTFLRLKPRSRGAFFARVNGNRDRPGFKRPDCVAEVRVLCERVSLSACLSVGTGIFLLNWGAEQAIRR
jgi:hypothetical protein